MGYASDLDRPGPRALRPRLPPIAARRLRTRSPPTQPAPALARWDCADCRAAAAVRCRRRLLTMRRCRLRSAPHRLATGFLRSDDRFRVRHSEKVDISASEARHPGLVP